MSLDWMRGYTTDFILYQVDPKTWAGFDQVPRVKSFKVNTNGDGDVPLLQSGSMTVVTDNPEDLDFGWYQMFVTFSGGTGAPQGLALATMLFEADSATYDFGVGTMTIKGQSVLKPCSDRHMEDGEFIPKGTDGSEWCRKMLAKSTPAPVVIDKGSFDVTRHYVFDSGTSYLKAVWKILDSAGWVIRVTGDGVIHLRPKQSLYEPNVIFEKDGLSLFHNGVDRSADVSDVPNLYFASLNGETATARNESKSSRVSIPRRGYVKDFVDTDPVLIDGETLKHYAQRRLEEESSVIIKTYSYTREIFDDVFPLDVVRINIPNVFTGNTRVISQAITCSEKGGITIDETVGEEVKLWTR